MARSELGVLSVFERTKLFRQGRGESMLDFEDAEDQLDGFSLENKSNLLLPVNQRIRREGAVIILHSLDLSKHSLVVAGLDFPNTYDLNSRVYND